MAKIGYEFEFLCNRDSSDIERDMEKIFGPKNKFRVTTDGSIKRSKNTIKRNGWHGVELITPPLTKLKSINTLNILQLYLDKIGAITNNSTGFHINVSSSSMRNFDPMTLIGVVDESRIARTFGRELNPYCVPWAFYLNSLARSIKRDKSVINKFGTFIKEVDAVTYAISVGDADCGHIHADRLMKRMIEKYMTTNISKLQLGYVEYRMLGGKDYHKKGLQPIVEHLVSLTNYAAKGKSNSINNDYYSQYKDLL
jgi:hypothetical protein